MKRLLVLVLGLGLVTGLAAGIFAATNDSAYVIARCTVTISVRVGVIADVDADDTDDMLFQTSGLNSVYISTYVNVTNNGTGAITKWTLHISTQWQAASISYNDTGWSATDASYPAWTYGANLTDNSANRVVLAAVFKNAATASESDFAADDVLGTTDKTYQTGALVIGPAANDYTTAATSGNSYNMVAPGSTRQLFFRVLLPSSVTDDRYRRMGVMVTASLGL